MDKSYNKKTGEELQQYMQFQRRGTAVKPKKGKGSFKRKPKHKNENQGQKDPNFFSASICGQVDAFFVLFYILEYFMYFFQNTP